MKHLIPILFLLMTGCLSSRNQFRIKGGTEQERAMVHGAFNNMVPELKRRGFTNARKPRGEYTLRQMPTVHVYRMAGGGEQGTGISAGQEVGARANQSGMIYARPLHPWIANHEVTHSILEASGYTRESRSHDLRAFDDGAHFPHRGRVR
jgi:hypothetical protein